MTHDLWFTLVIFYQKVLQLEREITHDYGIMILYRRVKVRMSSYLPTNYLKVHTHFSAPQPTYLPLGASAHIRPP